MRLGTALCSVAALLAAACSDSEFSNPPSVAGFSAGPAFTAGTDVRAPVTASKAPPPISGGTLIVTHDGQYAIAADPDRDRVSIVGIKEKILLKTVELDPGDEPGRVTEDAWGTIHVALRRGGAVVAIDPAKGAVLRRTNVCGAPRGIAFEAATKQIHVACAGGEFVSLPAEGGAPVRTVRLVPDLRDVIVTPTGLFVSRFKSASLLRVDANGSVAQTMTPQRIGRLNPNRIDPNTGMQSAVAAESVGMDPAVAWRSVAAPSGDIVVLHQYGLTAPIDIGESDDPTQPRPVTSSYGAPMGSSCGGLVSPGVSTMTPSGQVFMGAQIGAPVLAVDVAMSPDGARLAFAHAGTVDPEIAGLSSPFPTDVLNAQGGQITIMLVASTVGQGPATENCAPPESTILVPGQTTAVAFNPRTDFATSDQVWLVAQTREPARLAFVNNPGSTPQMIELGGTSMLDTGHEVFHRDSGFGVACAQCHAEGGEDGRVWKFNPSGERRTQALHVGISGTEPFHWDGDMTDIGVLMEEVFVRRMGGPHETPERMGALQNWLSGLKPPAAVGDASSAEAVRGKVLFESTEVGCASCHSGDKHTNNESVFVGTTAPDHLVQVPSLVGIAYRAPFLHDGCAATLRDRFDPTCGGGERHGKTAGLSEQQLGDLVAYLETL